jgi:hypothetical protein
MRAATRSSVASSLPPVNIRFHLFLIVSIIGFAAPSSIAVSAVRALSAIRGSFSGDRTPKCAFGHSQDSFSAIRNSRPLPEILFAPLDFFRLQKKRQ